MKLNPHQNDAVHYIATPLLVLAGAGSGKTRVITNKIAYLIQDRIFAAQHIAAVTFTSKAAREMRERLHQTLGSEQCKGLWVSTFHSLGLEIVKKEARHLGFKPGFSIFDEQDSLVLLKELAPSDWAASKDSMQNLQQQISRWKNELCLPEQAIKQAEEAEQQAQAVLYQSYQHHLKAYNAVDFDDLILHPTLLFAQNPQVRSLWQQKIRYLLIDEYQDTNSAQYQFFLHLVGSRGAFTVVGDDDQSIYSWRGARPQNLIRLRDDFPSLRLIKLEQNYRSSGCILKAANTLIAHNPHVFDKKLWSELGFGEPLRVIQTADEQAEAERVVTELCAHKFRHGHRFGDYAILYRGNHQSRLLEKVLTAQHVPYRLSGGTSFFSRSEIKDVLAYLRLLVNPEDDNAFLRIANVPRRELGPSTLEKLGQYAHLRQLPLYAASFELGLEHSLQGRGLESVRRFSQLLAQFGQRLTQEPSMPVIRQLLQQIDYFPWLLEDSGNPKSAEYRSRNVQELLSWVEQGLAGSEWREAEPLDMVLSRMMLRERLQRQDSDEDEDQVQLMTLHASKGLEFPFVFMVGMEEELLPHKSSIETDDVDEERRLAYVGITRAQRGLTFSLALQRKSFGEVRRCQPSRFLSELPQEDLDWQSLASVDDPVQKKLKGRAHLAALRQLLDPGG